MVADAEKSVIRFDEDPMAQHMSSIHASDAYPMLDDVDDEVHAVSSSSHSKRRSDDHDEHKRKRHKHKHHKHKEKHRKKRSEKHKEKHRDRKSRRAEKDKQRSRPDGRISSSDSSDRGSDRGSDGSNRSSAKPDRSSSPDIGPPLPVADPGIGPPLPLTGPEIGPPMPPAVSAHPLEKNAYRPTHEAFSSLGKPVLAKEDSQPTQPRDGGKNNGACAAARVFRCLVCGVDACGEATFMQHLCGSAHQKKNQGHTGFAGLAPNSMGRIPPLVNAVLRAASTNLGQDPDGSSGLAAGSAAAQRAALRGHC